MDPGPERMDLYPSLVEEAVEIEVDNSVGASAVLVVDNFVPVTVVRKDSTQFVLEALEVVRNVVVRMD